MGAPNAGGVQRHINIAEIGSNVAGALPATVAGGRPHIHGSDLLDLSSASNLEGEVQEAKGETNFCLLSFTLVLLFDFHGIFLLEMDGATTNLLKPFTCVSTCTTHIYLIIYLALIFLKK